MIGFSFLILTRHRSSVHTLKPQSSTSSLDLIENTRGMIDVEWTISHNAASQRLKCLTDGYNLIPPGLPRDFSRGVSKGERAFAPLWSPSARVSRAGEIITGKIPRGLPRGFLFKAMHGSNRVQPPFQRS